MFGGETQEEKLYLAEPNARIELCCTRMQSEAEKLITLGGKFSSGSGVPRSHDSLFQEQIKLYSS